MNEATLELAQQYLTFWLGAEISAIDVTKAREAIDPINITDLPKSFFAELAAIPDERALIDLPRLLVTTFNADIAYIRLLKENDRKVIATENLYYKGNSSTNLASKGFIYNVLGAPCALTIQHGRFAIPAGCLDTFEQIPIFKQLNVQGYAGVAVRDGNGTVCDVLVILSTKRLADPDRLLTVLELLENRVSSMMPFSQEKIADKQEKMLLRSLLNSVPDPIFCKSRLLLRSWKTR